VEWKSRRKNGEIFGEEVTLTSLVIDGVRRILSTAIDITERKKVREELYRVSILDPLTGLYNRRFIFERLEIVITEYQRVRSDFSVALIDLDFFKRINDSGAIRRGISS
jgi:PleD family two-component response regulator